MEKIISDEKRKRIERNAAIVREFAECMEAGSDKTATYKYLADRYGLKAPAVYQIIRKSQEQKKKRSRK